MRAFSSRGHRPSFRPSSLWRFALLFGLLSAGVLLVAALPLGASRPSALRSSADLPDLQNKVTPDIRLIARGKLPILPDRDPDAGSILLANGLRFDPLRDGEPRLAPASKAAPVRTGQMASFLVQLAGPVQKEWRDDLDAKGVKLFAYLPNDAFLVRLPAGREAHLASLPYVRWVGAYHPAYKLSPQPEMQKASGPGTLVILLFPDASLQGMRTEIQGMGGSVLEATDSGRNKIMRVNVDMSRVTTLAAIQEVAWIEPWHELEVYNNLAQWVVQTNISENRRVWDMGLHGEGQVVHTSDSGIRTTHNAFRDAGVPITTFGQYPTHRKIIAYIAAVPGIPFGDHLGASYHGTHTAGTFIGDDSPFAADLRDGMALKAKIYFSDAGGNSTSISTPGDLNLLFQPPYDGNAGGAARISSNSWGGGAAGAYTVLSMTADQFMWDHRDFLINFSNGNAGPSPNTTGSPASFKNGISSGATQNGTSSGLFASFSSQGPAADGRFKPTVMSPGQNIFSANGAGDTGYKSLSGTSMSCPSGSGAEVLIRQYLTDGWYPTGTPTPSNAFLPSAALVKAMTVCSTDNDMTGQNIPNNVVGWGRMKIDNILYFPGDLARVALVDQTDGVETGEFIDYEIDVTDASVPLKITLCWTDKEGNPGAARAIVNDLDLTVTDPSNTVYLGNVFAAGQSAPLGSRDQVNVEECVRRTAPGLGRWKIRVAANNVPFGPQPFALAISGGVGGNAGLVQLDRNIYGPGNLIEIRVEDQNASSPISVQVSSTTESTPETVSIAGSGGVFVGTLATTAASSVGGDAQLSISHGDAILASYSDASPAVTVTASAVADFEPPVITNVGALPVDVAERIVWSTDTQATSRVYYGTTPALGSVSSLDTDLVTSHAVLLDGLAPETTYYFDVESGDRIGHLTRDDAGGNHYRFTTGRFGDILLVLGDTSFGGVGLYQQAASNKGWEMQFLQADVVTIPEVGNRTTGLRSYAAVWWQVGQEQYPPFEDAARDSVSAYLQGGGRLSVVSHDLAWAFTDPTSGYSTPARLAWLENELHVHFLADPATWPVIQGTSADPISGAYVVPGLQYTPIRSGGAGDEISIVAGTGTGSYVWRDTDSSPDNIGMRWVNGVPNGNPANAVWGGTPTKIVMNHFEWTQINDVASREDVFDKTLIWLIGHDHPDVVVQSPNGGETITTDNTSITWTETAFGGASVGSRRLEYSSDGGSSWTLISAAPGTSPYNWDVSGLANGIKYRVRMRVLDDASPALRGVDVSNADFAIQRPGADASGPVVVAGSIQSNPNPIDNHSDATLTATVSDANNGGSNVVAAEWSLGDKPAAAGSGRAMTGAFGTPTVAVSATLAARTIPAGTHTLWVRGRDAAGLWGNARSQSFVVNGLGTVDADERLPRRYALHQNTPNPFNPTTSIRYDLPRSGRVDLAIYNVRGERVRNLVAGHEEAGRRTALWDGRDDLGRPVTSGIYFYRLRAIDFGDTKKMVMLK